jgi:hypothetical protein
MSIIRDLGLYEDDFRWDQLATCKDWDTNDFFDNYENDKVIAHNVDQMCLSCPVADQCFEFGKQTKSYGVFGGVYLENGRTSKNYNTHKSADYWRKISDTLGENVRV